MSCKIIFLLLWITTLREVSAQTDTSCSCSRISIRDIEHADLLEGRITYSQFKEYLGEYMYGLESVYPHVYCMDYKTTSSPEEIKTTFTLYTYQPIRVQIMNKEGLPFLLTPCNRPNRLSEIKVELYQNVPLPSGLFTGTPREYFSVLAKKSSDSSGTILKNMLPLLEGKDKIKAMITLFERKFYPLSTDTLPKDPEALLRKMDQWISASGQEVNEFVYRECIDPYVLRKEQTKGKSVRIYDAPLHENPEVIDRFNILFQKQLKKIPLEKYTPSPPYHRWYAIAPEMAYLFSSSLLRPWDQKNKTTYEGDTHFSRALMYSDTLKIDAEKGIAAKKVNTCFNDSEISGTGLVLSFDEMIPFVQQKKYLQEIDPQYVSISDSLLKIFSGVVIPEATLRYYQKRNEIATFQGTYIVITSKYIAGTMEIKGKISGDWFYPLTGEKISLKKLRQELEEKFYRFTWEEQSGTLRIRFIRIA